MAPTAEQALAALDSEFALIVVLDRNLPGMDGLSLCRAIRGRAWPGYVYVLLLTVRDGESDILAGLDAGADDYVSKRASGAQLLARLRTAQRILSLELSLRTAVEDRRQLALTDELTGAFNRRHFMGQTLRDVKRALSARASLSLLLLDIDHFKRVNDAHGHAGGDAVLVDTVRAINAGLPEGAWCARIGGEEFAVVLPGHGTEQARAVAESLRAAIESRSIGSTAGFIKVTASFGVTTLSATAAADRTAVDHLILRADQSLYKSKDSGRNRVTVG